MKKTAVIAMMILVASIFSAAVFAQYSGESPSISVSITSQDPDPVEPGRQAEVSFKIDNDGAVANQVVFEVIPEYPFSLLPGESKTKEVGVLGNTQNTDRSITVKFKLKVDPGAVDGNNELKVRYKYGDSQYWTVVEDLVVKVQAHDAIIAVDKFSTDPAIVVPGSKTSLTIMLKNYATSSLKDVKLLLDLGSGTTALPFSPVGSTNEKVISLLDPQSTKAVQFDLIADADAVSKSYKVPLVIKYSDLLNKNYSKSNIVTVIVGGEPEVSVGIDSTGIYSAGTSGDITVKIVNRGLQDMKFVNLNLVESEKYRIISPSEVYIGNIDSDDYETADFKLFVESSPENEVIIPMTVSYKDSNNKKYDNAVNLKLQLYSAAEAKKFGLVQNGGGFSWMIILVVAVALFFGYRLYKKRKKH